MIFKNFTVKFIQLLKLTINVFIAIQQSPLEWALRFKFVNHCFLNDIAIPLNSSTYPTVYILYL